MTTYYVSSRGNASDDGLSPDRPFGTLDRINAITLGPSDCVLLERGSVFNGQHLHVTGAGAPNRPITIGSYGNPDAPKPVIHADGTGVWHEDYRAPIGGTPHKNKGDVSSALLLRDVPYIEIRDLEITNKRSDAESDLSDPSAMDRTGVAVIAENAGTISHVLLENLHIHDIEGNIYNKHMANGGIYAIAHMPEDPARVETDIARFDDLTIRNCTVQRASRWGIAVGYTAYLNMIDHGHRDADGHWDNTYDYGDGTIPDDLIARYGMTNVLIENNLVEDAGGDAITVMYCDRPLVRRNISRRAARQMTPEVYTDEPQIENRVAAAIWPWRCKNAVFEYNEAYDTLCGGDGGNGDAQAWDADWADGTIYRYNFSRGNTGGTVMFCLQNAVHSEFCHNVAVHDLMGAIDIQNNPDAWVHDNVFILADDCQPLRNEYAHRANGTAVIERNVFVSDSPAPRTGTDWHPEGSHVTWRDNLFINFADQPQ